MEVVTIEKRTFSYVCESFTEFAKRIESLCSSHTQKVENWLDSQEVCLLLGFSKRTLQYYRSSGRLAYSQIGSKIYYKSSDIERIIKRYKYKIATSDNLLVWNFPIFAICNLNDQLWKQKKDIAKVVECRQTFITRNFSEPTAIKRNPKNFASTVIRTDNIQLIIQ